MKKILQIIGHILFAVFAIALFALLLVPQIRVNTANGDREKKLSYSDINGEFEESAVFNTTLGMKLSDVIEYAGINNYLDSDEYKESVSGNSLKDGEDNDFRSRSSQIASLYSADSNNVRFAVYQGKGDNFNLYTNLTSELINSDTELLKASGLKEVKSVSSIKPENLKSMIIKGTKGNIYFDPKEHVYETDTDISENTIYYLFNNSGYEFDDDTVLIFSSGAREDSAKDVSFKADDDLKKFSLRYKIFADYYFVFIVTLIVTGALYLLILLVLTFKEGVVYDKETKRYSVKNTPSDHIPTELRLFAIGVCVFAFMVLKDYIGSLFGMLQDLIDAQRAEGFLIVGICAFIISAVFGFFYYGFVRRMKGHLIWKTSLTKKLFDRIKKSGLDVYSHMGELSKAVIPYVFVIIPAVILFMILSFAGLNGKMIAYLVLVMLVIMSAIQIYLNYRERKERNEIITSIENISKNEKTAPSEDKEYHGDNVRLNAAASLIGESIRRAVDTSMKDEKMKADLITNVSHDIKTPLTSIINYVDLLKKENIDNENAISYIGILDEKSQRLKQLTDDLVEASKISSGNFVLHMEKINLKELISQASGEFADRFDEKNLKVVANTPSENVVINADSRSIYRVIENLYTNICKYALEGTRIYTDIIRSEGKVLYTVRNISAKPLNVNPEDLTERFIRGDESRTSEGSGLGLSIAKSLTEAMGGTFKVMIDADLFKVELGFEEAK